MQIRLVPLRVALWCALLYACFCFSICLRLFPVFVLCVSPSVPVYMFISLCPSLPLWASFASASCYAFLCIYTCLRLSVLCTFFPLTRFHHILLSPPRCVSVLLWYLSFSLSHCVFLYVHLHVYTSVFLSLPQVCPLLCLSLSVPLHVCLSQSLSQTPPSFYVYIFLFLCILKSFLCLSLCEHI